MKHISACESGGTNKSSMKISHAYASLIFFSKHLSWENKNTKAYYEIRTVFFVYIVI